MKTITIMLFALMLAGCEAATKATMLGVGYNLGRPGDGYADTPNIDRSGCNYRETAEERKACWAKKKEAVE